MSTTDPNNAAPPVTPPANEEPLATAAPPAADPPPAERTYTEAEHKAELERVVKERLAREKRKQPKQPSPPKAQPSPAEDVNDRIAAMEQELQRQKFDNEALRKGITNEGQLSLLRSAYAQEKPETLGDWLEERKGMFASAAAPAPEATSEEKAAPAPGNPASDGGAPSVMASYDGRVDLTQLSKDDCDRLIEQGRFKETLEKYRHSLPGGANGLFRRRSAKG